MNTNILYGLRKCENPQCRHFSDNHQRGLPDVQPVRRCLAVTMVEQWCTLNMKWINEYNLSSSLSPLLPSIHSFLLSVPFFPHISYPTLPYLPSPLFLLPLWFSHFISQFFFLSFFSSISLSPSTSTLLFPLLPVGNSFLFWLRLAILKTSLIFIDVEQIKTL